MAKTTQPDTLLWTLPLVFDESESQPSAQMKRLVDSVERLSEDEQSIIRELIDGMIIKYKVKRLSQATSVISN